MERTTNSNKKRETPAWMHETPCGDKSHTHQIHAFEAAARSICRLPKVMVGRKVDGVYQEAIEHHPSVRPEVVLAVNITAKRCVQKQEQRNPEKSKQEEVRDAEHAIENQEVRIRLALLSRACC